MAAVHVVTAAVVQDGLDGLITVRIISKARPCAKLTGMIEADLAPISHVSGSHQLGRTLHEVIIFYHHHRDSTTMRRCNVLCLHGTSCSKCWLLLHEEDVMCIQCHAHVPLSTQKQPFKRERGGLMHGHGWPREEPQ